MVKLKESRSYYLIHLYRMNSPASTVWTGSFPVEGMSGYFLLSPRFIEVHVFHANSVDPDQMPRSVLGGVGVCVCGGGGGGGGGG